MVAYGDAIERCSTDAAPWYVVPADRKWYRNWAITHLLIEQLERSGSAGPAPSSTSRPSGRALLAMP